MKKPTKTKRNNRAISYNTDAVKKLVEKYGYTEAYVRRCITHSKGIGMQEVVKKDYHQMVMKINETLNNL